VGAERKRVEGFGQLENGLHRASPLYWWGPYPSERQWGTVRSDPAWRDHLQFHEYFHGDTGAGLGASHQTGWTALVADLIRRGPDSDIRSLSTVLLEGPRNSSRRRGTP
jgi:hypothetical protein